MEKNETKTNLEYLSREKAIELMDRFYSYCSQGNPIDECPEEELKKNSKSCALICVEEILKSDGGKWNGYFYEKVKTELEKQ